MMYTRTTRAEIDFSKVKVKQEPVDPGKFMSLYRKWKLRMMWTRTTRAEIDFSKVKVKQEPVDPDDEPIITAEEDSVAPTVDTTHTTVLSSIDGNVQLAAPAPSGGASVGIRINISKTVQAQPITSLVSAVNSAMPDDRMLEDISEDDQPLPPGEESELEYTLKPGLEGISFSRQPPVMKGNELSGLCSIM
ncbi:hypothetical protein O0L34_g9149 [Tuta absoluta]|nr:hypothetical protein O0L34_g9149 [Tuta absoluta]